MLKQKSPIKEFAFSGKMFYKCRRTEWKSLWKFSPIYYRSIPNALSLCNLLTNFTTFEVKLWIWYRNESYHHQLYKNESNWKLNICSHIYDRNSYFFRSRNWWILICLMEKLIKQKIHWNLRISLRFTSKTRRGRKWCLTPLLCEISENNFVLCNEIDNNKKGEEEWGDYGSGNNAVWKKKDISIFIYIAVLISRDVKDWILNVKRRKEKKR